jgi:hypothetical protein
MLAPCSRPSYHLPKCPSRFCSVRPATLTLFTRRTPTCRESPRLIASKHALNGRPCAPRSRESGYEVVTIDPTPGLEDMVFAANQAFVGFKEDIGRFVVPSRMVYPSRQREVAFFLDWYRKRGYRVIEVDFGDNYFEGHGDSSSTRTVHESTPATASSQLGAASTNSLPSCPNWESPSFLYNSSIPIATTSIPVCAHSTTRRSSSVRTPCLQALKWCCLNTGSESTS